VDPTENARRLAVLIHASLAASIGVYAVVLLFLRSETLGSFPRTPPPPRLFLILAAIGLTQFAAASYVGRTLLQSRRSGAGERVRLYFLLRGAAAEAIALFGLLAGFLSAPPTHIVGLFALSLGAMLSCAPTRWAWGEALRLAKSSGP
jgi:hypothetical protein